MKEEKWQGKMICNQWEDVRLEQGDCFSWLSCWKAAPTHVVVGIQELYSYFQQRFSIIGRWGQVATERKGVECVERQQRVCHTS